MTREEVLQALTEVNNTIERLNSRLHPPPGKEADRLELEAELQSAQQSRATLEQILGNLPDASPVFRFP